MRPNDFNIQELITSLQGTCHTLVDHLPEGMEEEDLTKEDWDTLENEIFECSSCGWWFEICDESCQEENEERYCTDCRDEKD